MPLRLPCWLVLASGRCQHVFGPTCGSRNWQERLREEEEHVPGRRGVTLCLAVADVEVAFAGCLAVPVAAFSSPEQSFGSAQMPQTVSLLDSHPPALSCRVLFGPAQLRAGLRWSTPDSRADAISSCPTGALARSDGSGDASGRQASCVLISNAAFLMPSAEQAPRPSLTGRAAAQRCRALPAPLLLRRRVQQAA